MWLGVAGACIEQQLLGSFRRYTVKLLLIRYKVHLWLLLLLLPGLRVERHLLRSELERTRDLRRHLLEPKATRILVGLGRVGWLLLGPSVVLCCIDRVEVGRGEGAVWPAPLLGHWWRVLINIAGVAILGARERRCERRREGRASATAWIRLV